MNKITKSILLVILLANIKCQVDRDACPLLEKDSHHPSLILEIHEHSSVKQILSSKLIFKKKKILKGSIMPCWQPLGLFRLKSMILTLL